VLVLLLVFQIRLKLLSVLNQKHRRVKSPVKLNQDR
jgi:hypothetical protein